MAREGEIPESEGWYRRFVETLPQLLWTCRADGEADYLSKRLLEYLGVSEEQMLGFRWLDQIHPDDRAHAAETWRRAAAAGSEYHCEYRFRRNDGEYRWIDARASRPATTKETSSNGSEPAPTSTISAPCVKRYASSSSASKNGGSVAAAFDLFFGRARRGRTAFLT